MLGARDLRAFCRPPQGVSVAFAGVSTYADDGTPVCGLFDRPIADGTGYGAVAAAAPELRLPYNAFSPMPRDGSTVTVTDEGISTQYLTGTPTAEDDGAFLAYQLRALHGITVHASYDNGQSIASDVLDTVVSMLGGNAANVWRCRFRDFGMEELPADNVLPDMSSLEYQTTDDVDRTFRFFVRHTVASANDDADKLADARYVRAAQLLMLNPTLGGLVRYTREVATKWEMEQKEFQIVAYVVTYEVEFSTSRRDPSVAGY